MISTGNKQLMPQKGDFQRICKAISVLDAIFWPEWEDRYYSYNSKWSENEEFFEMKDGCGDQMMALFLENNCILIGLAHEYYSKSITRENLLQGIPEIYNDFIFGEPASSTIINFCLWTNNEGEWKTGKIAVKDDGSEELLNIFDGNPQTYADWALEYFFDGTQDEDEDEDYYKARPTSIAPISQIYQGKKLTKEMVLQLDKNFDDWERLGEDLDEIGYDYNFN
ncbi:hypothetical protein [Flavobacterium mesophilum]|uniref:hypothetical protein n=1 Tax=Flavobacterium mesophilum TaxID=3143495 RepID=UPI0031CDEE17